MVKHLDDLPRIRDVTQQAKVNALREPHKGVILQSQTQGGIAPVLSAGVATVPERREWDTAPQGDDIRVATAGEPSEGV